MSEIKEFISNHWVKRIQISSQTDLNVMHEKLKTLKSAGYFYLANLIREQIEQKKKENLLAEFSKKYIILKKYIKEATF